MGRLVIPFSELDKEQVEIVGGKNASLGEMIRHLKPLGVSVPDGFATAAEAFKEFLKVNDLTDRLKELLNSVDRNTYSNLNAVSKEAKSLVLEAQLPDALRNEITQNYERMCKEYGRELDVAVRSSATAEDLPTASFAGQHESFLNVRGVEDVLTSVKKCFASLYNARAIKYRNDNGFEHEKVALSAGVQLMVRSDRSSSGVCFTIDPDSGFRDVIVITGCWGLGENIVQGIVTPDEFHVFKPMIGKSERSIISRKLGSKAKTLIYRKNGSGTENINTDPFKQKEWTLSEREIEILAKWSSIIEQHYGIPMDIEWAKDGESGELFIVQARPETVHSGKNPMLMNEYTVVSKGEKLVSGNAVGTGITAGVARVLHSTADADKLREGEVLVTESTNPDWDPIMKKAAAIITNKGGRTSHAAIVARELGAIAIVGAAGATDVIKDGDLITVDNTQGKEGFIYRGKSEWKETSSDLRNIQLPRTLPMLILADPDKAYKFSFYPNQGVGLMRLEFVINNVIRIHPMALVNFGELKDQELIEKIAAVTEGYADKKEYFIEKLSEAVGTIAAAFYPKQVIVRMSDFKSNEYADLIGGHEFELDEENPMIGFRGASRYYHERYREGFRLECAAMKRVRNEMGLTNVKLMIPFCRTVEEGKKVIGVMEEFGLKRGENGLEVYVMAEIPSNVILAEEFATVFDGFSIGSNDLTQLTLGIDRDSSIISSLFDENNGAVKEMITQVVTKAKKAGVKIGLCGQAPSDYPEFAKFLIGLGIDSISFNPDALIKGIENMNKAEMK